MKDEAGSVEHLLAELVRLRAENTRLAAARGDADLRGASKVMDARRAEEALVRSSAVLKAQQEAALDGILLVDEHQRVISYNRRFVELWGIPADVVATLDNEHFVDFVAHQLSDPDAFRARLAYLYAHPTESLLEELVRRDGSVIERYSAPAQAPDGQLFGRVWYFRDVTDRKVLEDRLQANNRRLEELMRLQNNFVHSVSHELRTPLTSIVGYSEFLEDSLSGLEQAELLEYVQQIQLSTSRLTRLLDDLLDFALMEAGTFKLKCERMDLAAKVREIAESFRPQVARADLRLEVVVRDEPLSLVADPQRVGQVLTNLISNAVKLTPAGGLVRVTAEARGDRLRVAVEDTGPGIPETDIPRLFHRFSQLENGLRRGGTGLGLSISKGLIEAHGGEIGLESRVGHGSTFYFALPLSPGDDEAAGA